ncbi:MAG TPA: ECF-type sigma factor [Dokdonella sp.]|uniref:ECF-type sigma factor n=1 Tax=Dokdonella sp. TaxID=2291710 RepID=UPI002C5EA289|nr:ECF-type sigma factor [Dokdonella sp.]HUD41669.1 ECF-type sigma factor [Dokdonella sp.]
MTEAAAETVGAQGAQAAGDGARGVDELFTEVYARLKAMASRKAAAGGATLDTTALVHELYLRMQHGDDLRFDAPAQFFGYAARAMRHLLANRARDRLRLRAGGAWARVTLDTHDEQLAVDSANEVLALEESLQALEHSHARAARVIELRYFAGLPVERVAELLEVDRRTVHRDWRFARAFLNERLG